MLVDPEPVLQDLLQRKQWAPDSDSSPLHANAGWLFPNMSELCPYVRRVLALSYPTLAVLALFKAESLCLHTSLETRMACVRTRVPVWHFRCAALGEAQACTLCATATGRVR